MPSFRIAVEPNRRAAARFVQQVRRALQKALEEEQRKRGLSQAEIARLLKVNRSVINRELKGFKDITLGRVGELAWALGRQPRFSIEDAIHVAGANHPDLHGSGPNTPVISTASASSSNAGVYNVPGPFASAA
ncbi:hypothetical protein CV770_18365 [Bradyrhizobium sp. AC87j1]|nr:hypothetical protein CV770_18365 [Bradyrhizobium sp. AC87j1]